ncbi:MAG: hypothetical protein MUE33_08195 [Cytophagaceae bacterium]|jgi:hypothetical protein|nr:hypothetical protein [Cytophagaceae bacterium]
MKIIYGWYIWSFMTLLLISTEVNLIPNVMTEQQVFSIILILIGMFMLLISFSAGEIKHLIHPFRKFRRLQYKKKNYHGRWA